MVTALPSIQPMVYTEDEIEELKAECFANDVKYNYDVLKDWDEDKIRDFFARRSGWWRGGAAAAVGVKAKEGEMDRSRSRCQRR